MSSIPTCSKHVNVCLVCTIMQCVIDMHTHACTHTHTHTHTHTALQCAWIAQLRTCVCVRLLSKATHATISRSFSCNYFFLLQDGLTPVALASRNGHSDLVDLLVKQYGCSISDVEVRHVTYDMTCYHRLCHACHLWANSMFCHFPLFIHLNISSHTSLLATFSHHFHEF